MAQATALVGTPVCAPSTPAAAARGPAQLRSSFLATRSFQSPRPEAKQARNLQVQVRAVDGFLSMLGLGSSSRGAPTYDPAEVAIAQAPDNDVPAAGCQFACFGAGCFWGVELAFQRVPGVTKTEVGYTQGQLHSPNYEAVCSGATGHNEVVRVQYNPAEVSYESLLDVFWDRHDPTTLNRQGGDVGTQYRSGIYTYSEEQERVARASMEKQQKVLNRKIVTEVVPAKTFYRAENYHQQYLAKGGRMGFKQSAEKGCKDPIRCYG